MVKWQVQLVRTQQTVQKAFAAGLCGKRREPTQNRVERRLPQCIDCVILVVIPSSIGEELNAMLPNLGFVQKNFIFL